MGFGCASSNPTLWGTANGQMISRSCFLPFSMVGLKSASDSVLLCVHIVDVNGNRWILIHKFELPYHNIVVEGV
jgi:hypothetical protein